MRGFTARSLSRLVIGTSALALAAIPGVALAQDAAATVGNPGPSDIDPQAAPATPADPNAVTAHPRA